MKFSDFIQLRFPLKYRYIDKRKKTSTDPRCLQYPQKDIHIMQSNCNINQLSLAIATDYQPEENHPAYYIHQLIESLAISKPNIMGRPREYDPRMLLKLVLQSKNVGFHICILSLHVDQTSLMHFSLLNIP